MKTELRQTNGDLAAMTEDELHQHLVRYLVTHGREYDEYAEAIFERIVDRVHGDTSPLSGEHPSRFVVSVATREALSRDTRRMMT